LGLISFAKHAGQKILRRGGDDEHEQPPAPSAETPVEAPASSGAAPVDAGAAASADSAATPPSTLGTVGGSGTGRTYTTRAGDTLDVIAAYFYGDPVHRQRILDENPNLAASGGADLPEGTILRVPEDAPPAGGEAQPAPVDTTADDAEDAERLTRLVNGLGIPVQNLSIQVQGETATVTGTTQTQADREKVVLVVGNTAGISQVDDQLAVVTPAPEATFYEVRSGDTLSAIAQAQYGDASKYMTIFEANRPKLENPDLIYPGQTLRIPPA
jgi:nucleoid-associated protein YgaU